MDRMADVRSTGSRWIWVLFLSGIVGCAQQGKPLIIDKTTGDPGRAKHRATVESSAARSGLAKSSAAYVVGRGDTLYSIAWRNGTTVEEITVINRLRRPYTIYPGQRLRLTTSGLRKSQPAEVSPRERPSPPFTGSGAGSGSLVWHWPVSEQPVREFGKGNKGLDFDLRAGTIIGAAADGEVVYAGAGLGGYESLTIIRHISGFLSAYSLNGPIQHKEGDQVGRGDRVAEIVASGRLTRFHFEIRKDGDPVSPRVLLD